MRRLALLLPLLGALQACPDVVTDSTCVDLGTCPEEGYSGGSSGVGGDAGSGGSTAGKGGKGGRGGSAGSAGSSSGGEGAAASAGEGGGAGGPEHGGTAGTVELGGAAGAGGTESACPGGCGAGTPVCDEDSGTCVECLEHTDCGAGATPYCAAANECVACLGDDDCESPAAAHCSAGACTGCGSSTQCEHLPGTTVCDTSSDTCVECTAGDESACAGNSCNPATNTCTTTPLGSVDICEPCLADSECADAPGNRCVPMEFNGAARPGGFCLPRAAGGCTAPLTVTYSTASLSGAASESYCGIDQDTVTCEAVLDLFASADCLSGEDVECGCVRNVDGDCIGDGQGGLCRTVGGQANKCTYGCGSASQCSGGHDCTIGTPYCH